MAHKREQLESALKRAIATLLAGGMNDPRIRGLISVTSVKVSPEGRAAIVKISVLPEERERATLNGLRHAAGHIQRLVNDQLRIRFVPLLEFQLDKSLKKEATVLHAINQAMAQDAAHAAQAAPGDDATQPPTAPPEEPTP